MSATPPHRRSIWHNPWLWVTGGLVVVALLLAVWAAREQSNADDAKAELAAQQKPVATATEAPPAATPEPTQSPATDGSDDQGARAGAVAAVLAAARKALNDTNEQVDDL